MHTVRSILKEIEKYKAILIDKKEIWVRVAQKGDDVQKWLDERNLNEQDIILVNICW